MRTLEGAREARALGGTLEGSGGEAGTVEERALEGTNKELALAQYSTFEGLALECALGLSQWLPQACHTNCW